MKIQQRRELIEQYGPETIIEKLDPYINDRRKVRIDTVLKHRLNSIQLAIEAPSDIHNALACI